MGVREQQSLGVVAGRVCQESGSERKSGFKWEQVAMTMSCLKDHSISWRLL